MSTTCGVTGSGAAAAPTRRLSSFLMGALRAFRERRKREKLRAASCDLTDWELTDIGTTRGEIVASNKDIDPRGVRPTEWIRYLPTVDGQMHPYCERLLARDLLAVEDDEIDVA
jgi:hypothetical protein